MAKRTTKSCSGCSEVFTTYKNYDYCSNCTLNNSRYVPKKKHCPECGDGSGLIKFPQQPPRPCKLCTLTKKPMNNQDKFWDQVNSLAQEKIYHLLTNAIPLPNLKLITEPWRFKDEQQKLTGLFLGKDVDYRVLTDDIENSYAEQDFVSAKQELPTAEQLAEELAVNYFYLVFKALLTDLSDCYGYEPSYFSLENLLKDA